MNMLVFESYLFFSKTLLHREKLKKDGLLIEVRFELLTHIALMGSLCAMSLIMFYAGLIIFPLIACFYYILNAFATGFRNFNTK